MLRHGLEKSVSRHFVPRSYQREMISYMLNNKRCGIWAGMGLGKTVCALTAIDILSLVETRPVLVLAPLRVARSTWPDEVSKWEHLKHLRVSPVVGDVASRTSALRAPADIYTTNFEQLPWLVKHYEGKPWPFGTVIADESTRLKGFRLRQGGARAQALAQVAHNKVERFMELTGTPSPNGLKDLWGQVWFLDQGQRLGRTWTGFADRWFKPSMDGYGIVPLPFAQEQIQDRLRDLCLSLEAKDYFNLADPIVNIIRVELPKKARILYDDMEKRMFMELESHEVEAFGAAARTIKCLQLANGAAYVGDSNTEFIEVHDAKLQALESIVEEAAGAPILVAYHFKSDLVRLQRAFPQGRPLDADPRTIQEWNAERIPLLFAHPASAGHGLNLQDGGNTLAFFGHWWNLEEYQQIIERIGPTRQAQAGHDRPVFIHHIVAADTVDEMVMARRDSKAEVQNILMAAMKRKQK
jgi:SNF2 family DNA or RNA helicase